MCDSLIECPSIVPHKRTTTMTGFGEKCEMELAPKNYETEIGKPWAKQTKIRIKNQGKYRVATSA